MTCFIMLIAVISGCRMHSADSTWCDREVTIDGLDGGDEWHNARYTFEKQNVSVGLLNDDQDLYIRLATRSRNLQRQIMAAGFTIWFDAKGGDRKTLGIHFPLGMQTGGMGGSKQRGGMQGGEPPDDGGQFGEKPEGGITEGGQDQIPAGGGRGGMDSQEQSRKMLEAVQTEIEILGPGKDESYTVTIDEAQMMGIFCKMDNPKGNLVYELKIPLVITDAHPYGIGVELPKVVGIGLETGEMEMPQGRGPGGGRGGGMGGGMGGGPGGGMGGMGGGPGGGMGGGPGGGMGGGPGGSRPQTTEPLELWMKTKMATNSMTP